MSVAWQAAVPPVAEEAMRAGAVPGLVLAAARGGQAPEYLVLGADAAGRPLAADALFPVASITKLATALAVLRLVAAGALALDDPLSRHLPEATAARDGVTPRTLLCHASGLPEDLAEGRPPTHRRWTGRRSPAPA